MGCDICGRPQHPQRLPFLCPVDARNELYEPRIAHALALIQNEKLEEQVNAELGASAPSTDPAADTSQPSARIQLEALETERHESIQRTSDAAARARKMRRELEATRRELDRRRELLRQRRSDLAAAANGTAARRQRMQADVERAIAMTKYKWNQNYEVMTATRGFLCFEASRLYGLRRINERRGGSGEAATAHATRYEIGGFEVIDPYNMNNLPPEVVSTSLAHITHILVLTCHYLSIRLPAEVTLPHRDYPRPTIFSLTSSYSHGAVPFPGTADLHPGTSSTAPASAAASLASGLHGGDLFQHVPRARPLFIDKPLGTLAREDGSAYATFLEGVSLLAYNIAWACCSQGVPITASEGKATMDDVFSMGRNLYNLLIGSQLSSQPGGRMFSPASTPAMPSSPPSRNGTASPAAAGVSGHGGLAPASTSTTALTPALSMGRYSHGTTHTFLGDDIVQRFKIPRPNQLSDRLKTKLSSESTMPDWEVLEDDAWAIEDEDQQHMEDGVLNRVITSPSDRGPGSHAGRSGRQPGGGVDGSGAVIVGSRVPEKRLYGVESVATVMEESVNPLTFRENRENQRSPTAVMSSARMAQRLTPDRGGGSGSGGTGAGAGGAAASDKDRRPKGSGTSGWTKLRNR